MRGFSLALLAASAATLGACSVYDTSLLTQNPASEAGGKSGGGGGNAGEAGGGGLGGGNPGGGQGGGTAGATGCVSATYPPPPATADVPASTKDLEMVAVMADIDLGDSTPSAVQPTRFQTIGFDLDHRCTTIDTIKQAECVLPSYATGVLDGPNGQDNALGVNIQFIRDRISLFSSDIYTEGLKKGQAANVVVHMTGYNGEANDDQVRVETMVAADFDSFDPTHKAVPKWDGSDVWPIASDSLTKGNRATPKFVDDAAYVTNGKVVVTLPQATLRLITQLSVAFKINLSLHMVGASVVCDLTPTTVGKWGYTIKNCNLGARWQADDIIHQLSQFQDPLSPATKPTHLCTDSGSYLVFKPSVCNVTDSYGGVAGARTPCDSLSMGVKFNGVPGLLGDVFDVPPPRTDYCPPATDPVNDSCETSLGGAAGATGTGGRTGSGGAGGTTGAGGKAVDAGTDAAPFKDAGKG